MRSKGGGSINLVDASVINDERSTEREKGVLNKRKKEQTAPKQPEPPRKEEKQNRKKPEWK